MEETGTPELQSGHAVEQSGEDAPVRVACSGECGNVFGDFHRPQVAWDAGKHNAEACTAHGEVGNGARFLVEKESSTFVNGDVASEFSPQCLCACVTYDGGARVEES